MRVSDEKRINDSQEYVEIVEKATRRDSFKLVKIANIFGGRETKDY